jgi:hypothetical protein
MKRGAAAGSNRYYLQIKLPRGCSILKLTATKNMVGPLYVYIFRLFRLKSTPTVSSLALHACQVAYGCQLWNGVLGPVDASIQDEANCWISDSIIIFQPEDGNRVSETLFVSEY